MDAVAEPISWHNISDTVNEGTTSSLFRFRLVPYSGHTQESEKNNELPLVPFPEEERKIDTAEGGIYSKFLSTHTSDTAQTDNPTEITAFLLNYLMSAPAKMINIVFQLLRAKSAPDVILETSFEAYKTTNHERYLTVAKSLLEDFGKEAWPTLRNLSRSNHPDCDLFVRQIAQCAEVPAMERAAALLDIAKHPNKYVRTQVPEFLPLFGKEDQMRILQVLMNDSDPEIKEEAEEYFSVHSG